MSFDLDLSVADMGVGAKHVLMTMKCRLASEDPVCMYKNNLFVNMN